MLLRQVFNCIMKLNGPVWAFMSIAFLLIIHVCLFNQYSKMNSKGELFPSCSHHRKDFSNFSKANEAVRLRFLRKRAQLFKLGEPLLWEALQDLRYVWNYFPPTWTCPHLLERVGRPSDGGKWVCGLELFEKNGISSKLNQEINEECVIYSFGISSETTFEQEILERTNCQLFAFDHTLNSTILQNSFSDRFKFRSIGIKAKNGKDDRFQTLKEIMKENGHSWIDFFKMDIEGGEFEVLKDIANDFATWPFGHLNVEVHLKMVDDKGDQERAEFKRFNNLWTLLEERGLRAFTWEDNLVGQTRRNNVNSKPLYVEYVFLNIIDNRNKLIQF